jgi:hypothetical protein
MKSIAACVAVVALFCGAVQSTARVAEAAPSLDVELFKHAPAGTWAAFCVDLKALNAYPMGEFVPSLPTAPALQNVRAFTRFFLGLEPSQGLSAPRKVSYIARFEGIPRQQIDADLAKHGTKGDVEGRQVYAMADGGTCSLVDDSTVVGGNTAEVLAAALDAWKSPVPMEAELSRLLSSVAGDTIVAAASFPARLQDLLPPEATGRVPPFLAGTRGGVLGVSLADGLRARGKLVLGSPEEAQQALAAAMTSLLAMKAMSADAASATREGPPPDPLLMLLFDKLRLSADGTELRVQLALTRQELEPILVMFSNAKEQAAKVAGTDKLHNIFLGLFRYADAHNGQYPPDLPALVDGNYLDSADWLLDPSDTQPVPVGQRGVKCSYEYVGPTPKSTPRDTMVAYSRKGIYPERRNVLYADGEIRWVSEAELHDPNGSARTSLAVSYKGLVAAWGGEPTAEQSARLKKFYEVKE